MDTRSSSHTRGSQGSFPRTSALTEAARKALEQDELGSPRGVKDSLPDERAPGKQGERQPDSGRSSPESKPQQEHFLTEGGLALSLGLSSDPATMQIVEQPISDTRLAHIQPRVPPPAVPTDTGSPEPTGLVQRTVQGLQQEIGTMSALRVFPPVQIAPPRISSAAPLKTAHPLQYVSEEKVLHRPDTEQQPLTHTTRDSHASQPPRSTTDPDAQNKEFAQQPEGESSQRGVSRQCHTTPEKGPPYPQELLPARSGYGNVTGETSGMAAVSPGGAFLGAQPGADGGPSGSLPSMQRDSSSPFIDGSVSMLAVAAPGTDNAGDNPFGILEQAMLAGEESGSAQVTIWPFGLVCPANPKHIIAIPTSKESIAGCLHQSCELAHGLQSTVRPFRYHPCQICPYHGIPARKQRTLHTPAGQARGKMACAICGQMPFGKPYDRLQELLMMSGTLFVDVRDVQRQVTSTRQFPELLLGDLLRFHQERGCHSYTQEELQLARHELADYTLDRLVPRAAELDTNALIEIAVQMDMSAASVTDQLRGPDLRTATYMERVIRKAFLQRALAIAKVLLGDQQSNNEWLQLHQQLSLDDLLSLVEHRSRTKATVQRVQLARQLGFDELASHLTSFADDAVPGPFCEGELYHRRRAELSVPTLPSLITVSAGGSPTGSGTSPDGNPDPGGGSLACTMQEMTARGLDPPPPPTPAPLSSQLAQYVRSSQHAVVQAERPASVASAASRLTIRSETQSVKAECVEDALEAIGQVYGPAGIDKAARFFQQAGRLGPRSRRPPIRYEPETARLDNDSGSSATLDEDTEGDDEDDALALCRDLHSVLPTLTLETAWRLLHHTQTKAVSHLAPAVTTLLTEAGYAAERIAFALPSLLSTLYEHRDWEPSGMTTDTSRTTEPSLLQSAQQQSSRSRPSTGTTPSTGRFSSRPTPYRSLQRVPSVHTTPTVVPPHGTTPTTTPSRTTSTARPFGSGPTATTPSGTISTAGPHGSEPNIAASFGTTPTTPMPFNTTRDEDPTTHTVGLEHIPYISPSKHRYQSWKQALAEKAGDISFLFEWPQATLADGLREAATLIQQSGGMNRDVICQLVKWCATLSPRVIGTVTPVQAAQAILRLGDISNQLDLTPQFRCVSGHHTHAHFRDTIARARGMTEGLCQTCQDRLDELAPQFEALSMKGTSATPTTAVISISTDSADSPTQLAHVSVDDQLSMSTATLDRLPATSRELVPYRPSPASTEQKSTRFSEDEQPPSDLPHRPSKVSAGGGPPDDDDSDDSGSDSDRDGRSPDHKRTRKHKHRRHKSRSPPPKGWTLYHHGLDPGMTEDDIMMMAGNHVEGRKQWPATCTPSSTKEVANALAFCHVTDQFTGDTTPATTSFGGVCGQGIDILAVALRVLRLAKMTDAPVPLHASLWLKAGIKLNSTAYKYLQYQLPGFADMCLDEQMYHVMKRFHPTHSCKVLYTRQKERLLDSKSFALHVFLRAKPNDESSILDMFEEICLVLSARNQRSFDHVEAITLFMRVLPRQLQDLVSSKFTAREAPKLYHLSIERFREGLQQCGSVTYRALCNMCEQMPNLRQHNLTYPEQTPDELQRARQKRAHAAKRLQLANAPNDLREMQPHVSWEDETDEYILPEGSQFGAPILMQVNTSELERREMKAKARQDAKDKPTQPTETRDWLKREMNHVFQCGQCTKLGMTQMRVDKNGLCPFDPNHPVDPRKGHWRVYLAIFIAGKKVNGWDEAAMKEARPHDPEGFTKYDKFIQVPSIIQAREHNQKMQPRVAAARLRAQRPPSVVFQRTDLRIDPHGVAPGEDDA